LVIGCIPVALRLVTPVPAHHWTDIATHVGFCRFRWLATPVGSCYRLPVVTTPPDLPTGNTLVGPVTLTLQRLVLGYSSAAHFIWLPLYYILLTWFSPHGPPLPLPPVRFTVVVFTGYRTVPFWFDTFPLPVVRAISRLLYTALRWLVRLLRCGFPVGWDHTHVYMVVARFISPQFSSHSTVPVWFCSLPADYVTPKHRSDPTPLPFCHGTLLHIWDTFVPCYLPSQFLLPPLHHTTHSLVFTHHPTPAAFTSGFPCPPRVHLR